MARWAVFDVDGTLLPGTSMERMLMLRLLKAGKLPLKNMAAYGLRLLIRLAADFSADVFKSNKFYLKGLTVEEIRREAGQLVERVIFSCLSDTGLKRIERLRTEDYRILVMSGSPDFLVCPLAERLETDYTISARLETDGEFFTGRVKGLHPYGERKKLLLLQTAEKLQLDFGQSMVFADHFADAEHMALFGTAVAVNPGPRLKKLARQAGWQIEHWN